MLNKHRLPFHGTYHRRCLVAISKAITRLSHYRLIHLCTQKSVGLHGCEVVHTVSTMNIKQSTDGSYAVRWVDIASIQTAIFHTPRCPTVANRMGITAFHVYKFAKQAFMYHLTHRHFKSIVDCILKHHTVLSGLFSGVYQFPNIF